MPNPSPKTKAALRDLLAIADVAQVTPHKIQEWQAAAREVLTDNAKPTSGSSRGSGGNSHA